MGQMYTELGEELIQQQKIFFVGTAASDGRVNVSPKGMDSLRVLGQDRIVWLNLTGSGNETAAHILDDARMTLMFCAFEGTSLILRVYGQAKAIHPRDPQWEDLYSQFPPTPGARQVYDLNNDQVQTSCGMAVPNFDFSEPRDLLYQWAENKGESGIKDY
jgi:hypothetical protein